MTTILVTGSTDGIGKETARALIERGADVIVHGRTLAKARAVADELGCAALAADLTSLDEVRALAGQVRELDVLINNAGIYAKTRQTTSDGRELTMAVNHDAPFLLTHLLLPVLKKGSHGRVINVSSVAHQRGHIDVDDIDMARSWDGYGAYAASKLANVLFTVELAKRLKGTKVVVNALHPGVVSTKLLRAGFGMGGPDTLEDGAATSIYLALEDVTSTGRYFVRSKPSAPATAAIDAQLCARFYEASAKRVGIEPLPA